MILSFVDTELGPYTRHVVPAAGDSGRYCRTLAEMELNRPSDGRVRSVWIADFFDRTLLPIPAGG